MYRLDIVWMVVSPRSSHPLGFFVIGHDVVVILKIFVADGAYPALLSNFSILQFAHFGWRSQFPIPSRVVRIVNPLDSESDQLGPGEHFPTTASNRLMDWAHFIAAKSHGNSS